MDKAPWESANCVQSDLSHEIEHNQGKRLVRFQTHGGSRLLCTQKGFSGSHLFFLRFQQNTDQKPLLTKRKTSRARMQTKGCLESASWPTHHRLAPTHNKNCAFISCSRWCDFRSGHNDNDDSAGGGNDAGCRGCRCRRRGGAPGRTGRAGRCARLLPGERRSRQSHRQPAHRNQRRSVKTENL